MKILLATDGSEYSEGAAKFLTRLDLSSEDEIIIFHAICGIPCLYGQESYYNALNAIKKEIAPRILNSVSGILKPVSAKISTLILDGPPENSIIDVSVDSDADLIVMGVRGISGAETPFIGSVAKSVALNSSRPVLVTKLPVCEGDDKIKILFATDGSEHSAATAKILTVIPFSGNTEITVLNIMSWESLDIPKKFVPEINERFNEIIRETRSKRLVESKMIMNQSKEFLDKKFTNIRVLSEVGAPSAEIMKASEKLKVDITAVGCRGLRGIKGMLGSVSRNILTHSKCSVLIGKTCTESPFHPRSE